MAFLLGIKDALWRGPWVRVIFTDNDKKSLFEEKAYVKFFWGEDCKIEGEAKTFIDLGDAFGESMDNARLMLDICQWQLTIRQSPTKMVVEFEGQTYEIEVTLDPK